MNYLKLVLIVILASFVISLRFSLLGIGPAAHPTWV